MAEVDEVLGYGEGAGAGAEVEGGGGGEVGVVEGAGRVFEDALDAASRASKFECRREKLEGWSC